MADEQKNNNQTTPTSLAPETSRWTEIEHLPQWDEEYYLVYTAKKLGKWVMMKTLRPELRADEKYQEMLEKEFDVRYNLAHPNIVMINDLEDVPGVGRCIVTDDVYGKSLRQIIDEGSLTQHHLEQIQHQMADALAYIQRNHIVHQPIRPERIIFTENIENLKLIDVGFDQKSILTHTDVSEDIYNYGLVLREVLDRLGNSDPHLRHVAAKCMDRDPNKRYRSVDAMRMDLEGHSKAKLYMSLTIFLAFMVVILVLMQFMIRH